MKIDKQLYLDCFKEAVKVQFLITLEEVKQYASALYQARKWAKENTAI